MYDIRKFNAVGLIATVGTLLLAGGACRPAGAAPVAPDGAVSVNIGYDQGTSTKWYIELQRDGAVLVNKGIAVENDAEIRQGLLELDWGFNQEQADGSFTCGDPFHSTSLFMEAAARATIALKHYHPVSYTPDPVYYGSHITRYTQLLHQTALWITTPSVAALGQQLNMPYTHRRYLLAAGLSEVSELTGDDTLKAAALAYAQDGISRQLTSGVSSNVVTFPNGLTKAVSLVGVNPELGGYDVNYQAVGLEMAEFYYPYCRDAATKTALRAMLRAGLRFEYPWVALDGTITYTGSTRDGVELNRDGTVKQPDTADISNAFANGYALLGPQQAQTAAVRMMEGTSATTSDAIAANGADGSNTLYDQGLSATWDISNQKTGVVMLQAGIQREDPTIIQAACNVIDWGFAHQAADGSFTGTNSPLSETATFIETTARASSLLASYVPTSYGATNQASYYTAEAQKWATESYAAAKWMTSPTVLTAKALRSIASSPQHLFCLAAALQEQGALSGDAAMQSTAQGFTAQALALQAPDGAYLENGAEQFNPQAFSTGYAERIAASVGVSSPLYATLTSSYQNGLTWLVPYVDPTGTVTILAGSKTAASTDFGLGAELTDNYADTMVAVRMNWLKNNDTLTP